MYVSHAVRSPREEPIEGETVRLVVEPDDDADPDAVAGAAREAGATVEDRLAFGDLVVSVPHERIDDLLAVTGIAVVQTDNAVGIDPGEAEEDATLDP
jgi:hypothetical protein